MQRFIKLEYFLIALRFLKNFHLIVGSNPLNPGQITCLEEIDSVKSSSFIMMGRSIVGAPLLLRLTFQIAIVAATPTKSAIYLGDKAALDFVYSQAELVHRIIESIHTVRLSW